MTGMEKSKTIGTILVELQVAEIETGHDDVPTYLAVRGANIVSSSLASEQLNTLQADNAAEGVIGFENGCIDAALEDHLELDIPDRRVDVLAELLRTNFAPNMIPGAFRGDAVNWLARLDAAARA